MPPFRAHIDANQGYAEMLVRDSDPSQTARMLKRAIDDYGHQGRGDVADLLGRFRKIDAGKAEDLRRELHKATGEMLPYRIAPLGGGFREPTEEEKIAAAPKVPFGSAQGADRWAAGNMADALLGKGDYGDAVTHFQGEIGRNRAEAMPYLAAVHEIMGDKNPAQAAKFATQMQKAGLTAEPEKKVESVPVPPPPPAPEPPKLEQAPAPTAPADPVQPAPAGGSGSDGGKTGNQNGAKPVPEDAGQNGGRPAGQGGSHQQQDDVARLFGMPLPNDDDVRKETRETLEKLRDRGKTLGQDKASELLEHYLNGDGSPVTLDKDWVRGHEPIKKAEAKVQGHFENWLTGKGPKDSQHGTISGNIPRDGESVEIKNMKWDSTADNSVWNYADDRSNALGGLGVKGLGDLKLERRGDEVLVTGTVRQHAEDRYDFSKGKTEEEKKKFAGQVLPQGILGGNPALTRGQIDDLEKAGGVRAFHINTDPWTKTLTGRLKLDKDGRVIGSHFQWKQ